MWKLEFSKSAADVLGNLAEETKNQINAALQTQVLEVLARKRGDGVQFSRKFGHWPVRCDNYRILCRQMEKEKTVLVELIEKGRFEEL